MSLKCRLSTLVWEYFQSYQITVKPTLAKLQLKSISMVLKHQWVAIQIFMELTVHKTFTTCIFTWTNSYYKEKLCPIAFCRVPTGCFASLVLNHCFLSHIDFSCRPYPICEVKLYQYFCYVARRNQAQTRDMQNRNRLFKRESWTRESDIACCKH